MYEITRDYIKHGNARSGQQIPKVKFIVSHDIGKGGSTAYQNRTYFNNHQPSASAHTFIDDKYILEIIPLWEKAWHVRYNVPTDNIKFGADANNAAIGVELCHGGNINFNEAYKRYVWYHAYLCKTFHLNPRKDIVAHSELDPGRRSDPQHALNPRGISWEQFINDVAEAYGESPKEQSKPQSKPKVNTTSIVDYLKSIGADSSFSNRAKLAVSHGIKGYTGTASQNLTLLEKMLAGEKPKTPKSTQKKFTSIVDYLKHIGEDSSFSNRSRLAKKYGITNYRGTANQNIELLNKMQK